MATYGAGFTLTIRAGFKAGNYFFEQGGYRSDSLTHFLYLCRNLADIGEHDVVGWHADKSLSAAVRKMPP
ncbi:hypothetical protein [Enterobacter hormaechei]